MAKPAGLRYKRSVKIKNLKLHFEQETDIVEPLAFK